ncbi:MAG: hypothetical protein QNJ67_13935 [Kiloniellales bacterium]|nr:hypothetical protein [Kiloniellales bacterium]
MNRDTSSPFGIYQIHYKPALRRYLDPAFIPYENFKNERPEWREFHIFRKEWLAGTMDRHSYTGFFSWKFRQKAQIEGQSLLDFARANRGADCYFLNPFPFALIEYQNVWLQGEYCHPGLIATTEEIFRKLGYNTQLSQEIHGSDVACYCNFWFATPKFWNAYMKFCLPVYDYIENKASEEERSVLWAQADKKSDATMVPYIFERLFTQFISTEPPFEVRPFSYSTEHFQQRFHEHFNDFYREAEILKKLERERDNQELLIKMRERKESAILKCKTLVKQRRKEVKGGRIREAWNRFLGVPPGVLPP